MDVHEPQGIWLPYRASVLCIYCISLQDDPDHSISESSTVRVHVGPTSATMFADVRRNGWIYG